MQTRKTISGTFGATGNSAELALAQGVLSISGTFDATVELQIYLGGAWRAIDSFTSAEVVTFDNKVGVPTRFECTIYASGTVTYDLRGVAEPE